MLLPVDINKHNYEVSIAFFETCNLNCQFCFERHNVPIDKDKILQIPNRIVDEILPDLIKYDTKDLYLRYWGGELFQDSIKDDIFDCYFIVDQQIKQKIKEKIPSINIHTNWMSNGVWNNTDRVLELLKETSAKIGFSYDPIGRYTNEDQRNLMLQNIKTFKNYYVCTAITLTKPNIYALINGDEGFSKIPSDLNLEYNPYIANYNWKEELPNDEDIYLFYKWVVDNKHWGFSGLREIVKSAFNIKPIIYCSCRFAKQYTNGSVTANCVLKSSKLDPTLFYGNNNVDESNCTDVKNKIALFKRKCLTCEYFNSCVLYCATSFIFKHYEITQCPIKRIRKYIEQFPNLLREVQQWEKENAN